MPLYSAPRTATTPTAQSSLLTGLVSAWSLDEGSGVRFDSHGSNHLRQRSTLAQDNLSNDLGLIRAGVVFNGGSSLRVASNPSLRMGDIDFTIAFWINSPNPISYQCPLSEWNAGSPINSSLLVELYSGRIAFSVRDPTDSFNGTATHSTVLASAQWHLVICFHDAVNNWVGVIVNQEQPVLTSWGYGCRQGTADFVVGSYGNTYGSPLVDKTIVENLCLWKRLLTEAELEQLWNNGKGLRYPFKAT